MYLENSERAHEVLRNEWEKAEAERRMVATAEVTDPFEPDEGINPLYVPKRKVHVMLEIPADGKSIIDVLKGIGADYQKYISSVNVRDRSFD
jgi:hypothetical protein